MKSTITTGAIRITAISDGDSRLPALFYPGLDFAGRTGLLAGDGTYHIPTGCFLIQGPGFTVLVDAGIGPAPIPFPAGLADAAGLAEPPRYITEGGRLVAGLAALGVAPADITTVFLTDLHPDHIGWVAPGGHALRLAGRRCIRGGGLAAGAVPAAWQHRATWLGRSPRRGAARPVDGARVSIAPGVTAVHSPGHTRGNYILCVGSAEQEVVLSGDAIQHPLQLNDQGIHFLSDADRQEALATRYLLLGQVARDNAAVGASNLPGLRFRRVVGSDPRSWQET
jgi:glyoxylase-like metal-dependent hydrolase (beta-lactamase superfamily II)